MHRRVRCCLVLALLCLAATARPRGVACEEAAATAPRLRLIPIEDGLRESAKGGRLENVPETSIGKRATRDGVDLTGDVHPLLVAQYAKGRLFYVFYKTVEGAVGGPPYIIQRIKKTVRDWHPDKAEPTETVTWQVEVFKTFAGGLKRADQHYGSFGLRTLARREIVKEYEIGFGEIPGVCEGATWPFEGRSLFKMLQGYQAERALYDKVRFRTARRWSLAVRFDDKGGWRVASPELGFDAPTRMPTADEAAFHPVANTKDVILIPGVGVKGLTIGESREDAIAAALGKPIEVVRSSTGHRNHATPSEITVNVLPDGMVNTLITRTGFGGRTDQGVRIGSPRWAVMKAHGVPSAAADAPSWKYPGIYFFFDGLDRVHRMVVFDKTR